MMMCSCAPQRFSSSAGTSPRMVRTKLMRRFPFQTSCTSSSRGAIPPPRVGIRFGHLAGPLQDCSDRPEAIVQFLDVNAGGASVGLKRDRRSDPRCLSHAHRLRHASAARVRVVRSAKATTDDPQLFAALRHKRSVRDAINAALVFDIAPDGFFVATGALPVIFDRSSAESDLIVELSPANTIFLRQPILSIHAPRLTHADVMREANDLRPFVAGHHIAQKVFVDERLAAALNLSGSELLRVGRVGIPDSDRYRCDAALVDHRMGTALL